MPKAALKNKNSKSLLEFEVPIGGVSLTQKALFAKNLSVMLKAGMPIVEALEIAEDAASGRLKKIIRDVGKSVASGRSFSDSLGNHPKVFSGLFVSATFAGEESGTLVENLENIASELEKEKALIGKVRGAMIYPAFVLSAATGLGLILALFILPRITPLFEGLQIELPVTTRALIWFSHLVQDRGIILLFVSGGIFAAGIWLLRQKFVQPVTHWVLLRVPIFRNVVRSANLARFCRTLGMLLKSGLHIQEALDISHQAVGNYYYRQALGEVTRSIGKGTKLSDNLSEFGGLFPVIVTRMIAVGEESGELEDTLFYLADFYEAEVDTSTKTLSTAIEPALLIGIGLVVAFLALSIITPIYNITSNIQG